MTCKAIIRGTKTAHALRAHAPRALTAAALSMAALLTPQLSTLADDSSVGRTASAVLGPAVVPTAEGQIGNTPIFLDKVGGPSFESIRGQAGDLIFGGIFAAGGIIPPPPEFSFITDRIHMTPQNPTSVSGQAASFLNIAEVSPGSARSRNATNTGGFVAFSVADDGALGQMRVRIATFDETGDAFATIPFMAPTAPIPDTGFAQTGVAVDDQGRVTVAYSELPAGLPARVTARRFDAVTGLPLGGAFQASADGRAHADAALLDPSGNRLIVTSTDLTTIRGNIVDVSGPTPVVLPEFPISTTPALFANILPAVAADPATGAFTVAWENLSALVGDPANVRARRFDAMGNPIGNDFRVNTTTANSQGQVDLAYGPLRASALVWAGDAAVPGDELDVFLQVYDANGQPIGGEIRVNTTTEGVQDLPAVNFLPEPDGQGRPQVAVVWRDVGNANGTLPRGTGRGYRCFSIEGLGDPSAIFADGFESGDTSSWSSTEP